MREILRAGYACLFTRFLLLFRGLMYDGEKLCGEPEGVAGLPPGLLIFITKAHLVGQKDGLVELTLSQIHGFSFLSTWLMGSKDAKNNK